ncbi:MAG TPA: hypothetical protein VJX30_16735 [Terriglobales bacterium]|nr:hypothetical protein [Terriglobales bacterium]
MQNFTVVDTLGTLKACLALLPFMFAPGYVAGWALDLFEFRQRRPILRLILAVPLSIAICPMLSYLLARFLEPGLWVFYIGMFAACALLLAKEVRRAKLWPFSKYIWVALGLMALWGVMAIGSMVDLQIGDKLYPPIVAYDHSVRTALTVAIARHVPPNNPFFANAAAPLRYHYLWLLFCNLPMKVFRQSPRCVVYSGVVWCGVGLMCTIALGLKFLVGVETCRVKSNIERKTLLGIGLLSVTGLDILPTLYLGIARRLWLSDMEWWNEPQITSWVGSLLWVPHHVGALIACFIGFLLLRHQADAHHRWAIAPVIVAGMAFASAAGMSVYVTFTFVVAVALWLLALVVRKDWLEAAMFVGAGVVALLWALSYLSGLRGPGGGGAFVEVALRPFPLGVALAQKIGINLQTQFALTVANAILLPLNYALELGFFLAVGILRLRQVMRGEVEASANERAAWTLVMTSFLIGTFLRSSTLGSNDLGWRCFLPAQLILLLWGATMVHDWWFHGSGLGSGLAPQLGLRPWARGVIGTLLILGMLGTGYQVFMQRMFPILLDRGTIRGISWVAPNRQFGKRAYALRSAYEVLDAQVPASAVLQSNPVTDDRILHMLYSGHDTAAGNAKCGTDFGGDVGLCALRVQKLAGLFEFPDGANLDATCQEYGIDAVVAEDADRVWQEPSSWVWSRHPVVANDYVKAFRCGAAGDGVLR